MSWVSPYFKILLYLFLGKGGKGLSYIKNPLFLISDKGRGAVGEVGACNTDMSVGE